ncbi:18859_t:CDS:2, partial [Gigaspora margarita]
IPEPPTHDSKHTKLFVMGSNDCGELGLGQNVEEVKYPKYVQSLVDFYIVKISYGSLHVVTWGYNDEGALNRNTKNEENPDENVPAYAQGLDDVAIVKVTCGSNITLALFEKVNYMLLEHLGYVGIF